MTDLQIKFLNQNYKTKMKDSPRYVGNDISKEIFDAAFKQEDGKYKIQQFSNNAVGWRAFEELLGLQDICVLEATGPYHIGLATYLYSKSKKVCVVNPLSVKYFSRMNMIRAKTDKADACVIADYAQSTQPDLWEPQPAHLTELQQLMAVSEQLIRQKVALNNQLKSFKRAPDASQKVIDLLKEQISNLKTKIAQLDSHVKELVRTHYKQLDEVLQSIPGIGPKTAATLILVTQGFTKFDRYKALIAYAGLAPRTYQSGKSVKGPSRICKLGARQLRKLLYQCAQSAKRFNPICKKLFDRLFNDKKKPFKVAMIAVANKLIKLAFTIAASGQKFDPQYHLKFKATK